MVSDPFTENANIDIEALSEKVKTAVRLMDNVIDVSQFPLVEQENEAKAKRRIGLGVTGLADALILCGARYGGDAAVRLTETWMKAIERAAYLASTELAAEKGAFPLYDSEKYLKGEMIQRLEDRKSTRLNSSHRCISYAVFCLKKKNNQAHMNKQTNRHTNTTQQYINV